jgi:hypothetical protein
LSGQIREPAPLAEDANNQQKKDYDANLKSYKKANGFAVTLLSTTCEEEPLQLIVMFKTAREMWSKLQASYEQKSEQRLEYLYLQLLEYKKDSSDSVAVHISKLQKLWLELNEESFRIDACRLPQTLLIMRILSTLPEDYFEFRSTWESVPRDQRSIEYLLERLTMVEMRLTKRQNDTKDSCAAAALFVKESSVKSKATTEKKHGGYKKKPKDYSKMKCYNCGVLGHSKYKCPKKESGIQDSLQKGANVALYGEVFLSEVSDTDMWIADTGASHHMTKTKEFYSTYNDFVEPQKIMLGNNKVMLAYGQGDIQVETLVNGQVQQHVLKDVWYTPEVVKNLFSLPSAADRGLQYWLDKNSCKVIYNGATVVEGERINGRGLYNLLIRVVIPDDHAKMFLASKTETLQIWHERLGHQNKQYIERYLRKNNIEFVKDDVVCEGCILGKQTRLSFGTRVNNVKLPGDLVHADVCGPMQEDSFQGSRYFAVFKDEYSKYRAVYFLKRKSDVPEKLKVFLAEARTLGHTVKELLSDGGGEFDNKQMREITQEAGINHRMTMPYTAEQNGSAERENRTLMEAARSMLLSKQLPNKLWAEAVNTAAYVINRTGPTKVDNVSPYELWTGKKMTIEHLKVFGTKCFIHVPKQKRQKLDAKAEKGFLVGYCDNKDGYRVYVPVKDDVIRSRDVTFMNEQAHSNATIETAVSVNEETESEQLVNSISIEDEDTVEYVNAEGVDRALRDRRQLRQPARYDDFAMIAEVDEPQTFTEAMQSSECDKWQAAMTDEMTSLLHNNTWELVEKPVDRAVIKNRWVFKVKTKVDGSVDRFKARLVAKGYSQTAGIDYTETFSPVARFDSIRAVLSVAAAEKLNLHQFDVKTAFLYGTIDELIYMQQPEGFEDGTDRVCMLKKSLYGLKQSPRCWNVTFTAFLDKHGLKQSVADVCIFYSERERYKLILALYVDDGLIAYENKDDFRQLMADMKTAFLITENPVSCFLGLQIQRQSDGSVFISQESYARKILERFNMLECNKVDTPMDKLSVAEEGADSVPVTDQVPFREAIGSLMYLATGTRPDIMFAVSYLSQALNQPTKREWDKVKRVFKYLKGTLERGILFNAKGNKGMLIAYSDADFAGDVQSRRSTSGVVCMHMDGPVSWSSQRQRSVALSTTEAELIAASEAAKEVIWLSRLLKEITTVTTSVLYVDNLSTIKLIKNPVYHKRSKHVEVRHFFVREKVADGVLNVEHVSGTEQLADILTKPLPRATFVNLRDMLNIVFNV